MNVEMIISNRLLSFLRGLADIDIYIGHLCTAEGRHRSNPGISVGIVLLCLIIFPIHILHVATDV